MPPAMAAWIKTIARWFVRVGSLGYVPVMCCAELSAMGFA
jgi:hypothetical protein